MLLLAERWRMGLRPAAPSQVAAHAATPGPGPLRSASGLPGQLAFPRRLFTILPPTASVLLPGPRPKWLPPVLVQGSSPGGAPGPLVVRPASSPSCGSRWAGWGPHPWSASRVRVWIQSPSHRWTAVQGSMADPPHANCHGQSTCLPLGGAPINATGTFPLLYPGQRSPALPLALPMTSLDLPLGDLWPTPSGGRSCLAAIAPFPNSRWLLPPAARCLCSQFPLTSGRPSLLRSRG